MHLAMNLLSDELLTSTLAAAQPPCLSLYQPTHRHHPENQQDPIRFRNLVKQLQQSLLQKHAEPEVVALLEQFGTLADDRDFWKHTLDGLAVFAAPGLFRVFGLQRPVAEMAIVANSFHTKPLWRFLQSTDRYQLLALSLDRIRLYEGNRDALDEIDPAPGVPRTIKEALGEELTEPHQTVASYGGTGSGSSAMHHSHGGRKDEMDIDTERFFRAIDRAIADKHSRPTGLPLMLAALPEHHGTFHQVSHNALLLRDGIKIDPAALSLDQLRERAWQIMEPHYRSRLAALADEFAVANSAQMGLDDLHRVAEAAASGRVGTLLVEAGRQIAGRLDPANGQVELGELDHPEADDLLDDLGEIVRSKGGKVAVIPAEQMPTETGVAATCRF